MFPSTPPTMRAVVQDRYGDADTWRTTTVPVPTIEADDVLVRVGAAGLDRGTWHLMTGLPYLGRLAFGLRRPRQPVPGRDLAGTVVAVGSSVTRFAVGDVVFGIGRGSFAEFAAARADRLAHAPANATIEQAAVLGVSGLTALHAVRDAGRVRAGHEVLVVGASGGVGTYVVQIARSYGARVTGVASTAKVDLVRSLGADAVVDYTTTDFAADAGRYDVVIDLGGSSPLSRLRRALTPTGTLVIVGGEDGGKLTGMGRQLRAVALSPFVRQRLRMLVPREGADDLEVLAELMRQGVLTPSVGETFALDDAARAMEHLVAGRVRGKVAVSVAVAPDGEPARSSEQTVIARGLHGGGPVGGGELAVDGRTLRLDRVR